MSCKSGSTPAPTRPFRIPMRGYEIAIRRRAIRGKAFRIPMRGYEMIVPAIAPISQAVPNPHEGL